MAPSNDSISLNVNKICVSQQNPKPGEYRKKSSTVSHSPLTPLSESSVVEWSAQEQEQDAEILYISLLKQESLKDNVNALEKTNINPQRKQERAVFNGSIETEERE